ncbi:hypothetical protein C8P63_13714 [Melghirimyces profundicolus]|uniref:Uncharacterized protein n=1 Tax=Melghirimyces profundicolus TaxID=1242148 RepID=A0A2T6B2P4_9BACL|nr:hypothetical protein [Melghirimyces profundicolus]PTX50348.1 hypothetical protein C8P63_13714 [Melghirimyces profundicolus]
MLTLEEQQKVKRIRRSLTKLQLQVAVHEGRFDPSDLRIAVDNLCRAAETLAEMHLETNRLADPIRYVEEKLNLVRRTLMERPLTKR